VRRKPNRDRRVAPQGRTRYFLLQPSLPLIQATLVRGVFVLIARVRPVFFLKSIALVKNYYEKRFSYKNYRKYRRICQGASGDKRLRSF
jgi:hypothetical protein